MPKKRKKSNLVHIDFSGVTTMKLMIEGDYKGKPIEIEKEVSQAGHDYLKWQFEITQGKYEGRGGLYYNTSLQPDSLWNLKGVLESIGVKVPKSAMNLDLKETVEDAEECVLSIATDEYDGKKRSKISDINSASDVSVEDDYEDDDDAETVEKPDEDAVMRMKADELEDTIGEFDLDIDLDEIKGIKKKRAAVVKALDEMEDEEDEDDDEDEDEEAPSEAEIKKMKKDALQEVIDDHDLDIDLDDIKGVKKQRAAVIEALEDEEGDDEDDDEDDDDEDEKEKPTKKEVKGMDDDGLADVVFDHDLDIDLDDFKTLKKKALAVIKALEL